MFITPPHHACFQCNILWQLLNLAIGILRTLRVEHTFKFIDMRNFILLELRLKT